MDTPVMKNRTRNRASLLEYLFFIPDRLLPESENTFFGTAIDMRIRFDEDSRGNVVGFSILRGDSEVSASKIR